MFGHFYAQRDAELMKGGEHEQHEYARELLADTLNRGTVLVDMYHSLYDLHLSAKDGDTEKGRYQEALANFLRAFSVYAEDVKEGVVRARRARLVYGVDHYDGFGGVHTGSVDPELDKIGGSLVPWSMNEAIAQGNVRLVFPDPKGGPKGSPKKEAAK